MSLNFKSFIKNKSLFLIIVPSIILILGMIIYLAEEKVAEAAITLNPDNKETILLWCKIRRSKRLDVQTPRWINACSSS